MGKPFTTDGVIGVDVLKVDASASPQFAPLTRVRILASSTGQSAYARDAIYVKCGQIVTVSSNLAWGGTDGTVSVSAGGLVGLNAVTAAQGDWIWVRTSAANFTVA